MLDKNFWGTLLIRRNTISKRPLETLMKPRVKLSRRWLVYSLFSNRLFKFSFPLHSPILKPYFNLCFCKFQVGCYFNSSCPCKIFAKVELLLQFNQLSLCEGEPLLLTCCRFLLLVRACFLFLRDTCYCSCKKNRKKFLFSTLVYYSKSCLWVLRCHFESIHASNQTAHNFRCQKEISIFRYLELFFDYLKILTDYRSVRIYQTFLDQFYQYFVQSLLWFHQDQFGWRSKVVLEPQCLKWIKLFRMWAMRLEITWPFYAWFKNDEST